MQVKLRVIGGKNDGREIKIAVPEFKIGRGEGTHLRPQSDLISRHHCSIIVEAGRCLIRDLGSRNGTLVNGERVEGERLLKMGDRLSVGRLQFEVQIDHAAASSKKPRVEGVKEAALRAAANSAQAEGLDEDSITDWLMEGDELKTPVSRPSTETRQFVLDETDQVVIGEKDTSTRSDSSDDSVDGDSTIGGKNSSKKDKSHGKLPPRPKTDTVDSRDAASQVLRKFFNRR